MMNESVWSLKYLKEWIENNENNWEAFKLQGFPIQDLGRNAPPRWKYRGYLLSGPFFRSKHTIVVLKDGLRHNENGPAVVKISKKQSVNPDKFYLHKQYYVKGEPVKEDSVLYKLIQRKENR